MESALKNSMACYVHYVSFQSCNIPFLQLSSRAASCLILFHIFIHTFFKILLKFTFKKLFTRAGILCPCVGYLLGILGL